MTTLCREVLRIIGKKRKATDGGEGMSRGQHRSRPRSPPRAVALTTLARFPAGQEQPRAEGEVAPIDLTADTPPEGSRAEVPPTEAPCPLDAAPIPSEAKPAVEEEEEEEQVPAEPIGGPVPDDAPPPSVRVEASGGDTLSAVPSRPSLMNHGRLAERLMSHTHQPEFQMELHSQGANSFFRDVAVAQLWVSNSVAAMKDVLAKAEANIKQGQREAVELRTRAERAEGELAQVRVQLDAARDNVLTRDARLDSLRVEMIAVERRASTAEERARGLEEDLAGERAAKQAAEERASVAEGQATDAEGRTATAEERARGFERDLAGEKVARQAAEERASAAEGKVATAVEEYEKSPAFIKKMAEASTEVYFYGFKDGKEKVGRIYGLSGLDDIEPDGEPEEQAASPEQAGDEAGPSDA